VISNFHSVADDDYNFMGVISHSTQQIIWKLYYHSLFYMTYYYHLVRSCGHHTFIIDCTTQLLRVWGGLLWSEIHTKFLNLFTHQGCHDQRSGDHCNDNACHQTAVFFHTRLVQLRIVHRTHCNRHNCYSYRH